MPTTTDTILATRKSTIWSKLQQLLTQRPPAMSRMPTTPEAAFEVGHRMGLQSGYRQGLVDGVNLGMDVTENESADAPETPVRASV